MQNKNTIGDQNLSNFAKYINPDNAFAVGESRTGKSCFIKSNLLQMNASYIVNDFSGELFNSVGKVLEDHGYKVKVINLHGVTSSDFYYSHDSFEYIPLDEPSNISNLTEYLADKLESQKTAVFIVSPLEKVKVPLNMLYYQLFQALYHKCEVQQSVTGSPAMKIPVRWLMDEFANIGTIPNFVEFLSMARRHNISVVVSVQTLEQLKILYPDTWETIIGNFDLSDRPDKTQSSSGVGRTRYIIRPFAFPFAFGG